MKEIDRPLGQDRPGREPGRRFRLRPATLVWPAAFVAVFAAGAVLALREDGFRHPDAIATSVPEQSGPRAPAQAEQPTQIASAEPDAGTEEGPSIISVGEPDDDASSNVIVIRDPSTVGQNLRVAHLPDRALLEQSETGPLPIRAADGRRPVDVYARPWSGARGARVALVIGGLGLSQTGTQDAIGKLPPEVTLAFAPQGNSIDRWMQTARREGHEIVIQVPLEPFDYPNVNPGRHTLTTAASADQNLSDLRWALSRTTNYTGVMNYMGARFSADEKAFGPVMAELGERGLLFLDDGTSARSVAPDLAAKNKVPYAQGDAVIDAVRDRGAILKKLDELEATARAKGVAIGTGSAFPETVDAVAQWVKEVRKRGVEIVPVSALAREAEKR